MNIEMQFRAVSDPGLNELLRVSASLSENGLNTDIPTMKTEALSFTPCRQLSTESIRSLCSDEDYGTSWFEESTELPFESNATSPVPLKIISDNFFFPYTAVDKQVSSNEMNNTATVFPSPERYDHSAEELVLSAPVPRPVAEELVLSAPVPRPVSTSTFKPAHTINASHNNNPHLKVKVHECIDLSPLLASSSPPLLRHNKHKENNKEDKKTVWEIVKDKNATMDTKSLSISESGLSADAEPFYPSRYSII